jgi:hypothetical protein
MSSPAISSPPPAGREVYTIASDDDFVPIPQKRLKYRGINLSRSSVLRLAASHDIKLVKVRVTGGAKGRSFILRESIDAWINRELSSPENVSK